MAAFIYRLVPPKQLTQKLVAACADSQAHAGSQLDLLVPHACLSGSDDSHSGTAISISMASRLPTATAGNDTCVGSWMACKPDYITSLPFGRWDLTALQVSRTRHWSR